MANEKDKKIQEGEFKEVKETDEQPAQGQPETSNEKTPKKESKAKAVAKKVLRVVAKEAAYIAVGIVAVAGVFAIVGKASGNNETGSKEDDDSEGEDSDNEEATNEE